MNPGSKTVLLMQHHHDPAFQQLPPETYTYLIQALLSLQRSASYPYSDYNHPPSFYPVPALQTTDPLTPAQDPEGTDDALSVAQDKRRRNTAASARFRIKKKLKTLNLERTIADLTGRKEELEREANDLRRENAWLKEIVLLKGALNMGSQVPEHSTRDDRESASASSVGRWVDGRDKECQEDA